MADASIEIHVIAHEVLAVTRPLTGRDLRGSFPENLIRVSKPARESDHDSFAPAFLLESGRIQL